MIGWIYLLDLFRWERMSDTSLRRTQMARDKSQFPPRQKFPRFWPRKCIPNKLYRRRFLNECNDWILDLKLFKSLNCSHLRHSILNIQHFSFRRRTKLRTLLLDRIPESHCAIVKRLLERLVARRFHLGKQGWHLFHPQIELEVRLQSWNRKSRDDGRPSHLKNKNVN